MLERTVFSPYLLETRLISNTKCGAIELGDRKHERLVIITDFLENRSTGKRYPALKTIITTSAFSLGFSTTCL